MLLTIELDKNFSESYSLGQIKETVLTVKLPEGDLYIDPTKKIGSVDLSTINLKDFSLSNYPAKLLNENKLDLIRFVELRGKSEYSILDSVAKTKDIIAKNEVGIGLNDHGVGFGLYDFNQGMISAKKKPINGAELYIQVGKSTKDTYHHLVFIAKNRQGYNSLCRLLTMSSSNQAGQKEKTKLTRPFLFLSDLKDVDFSNFIILSAYTDSNIALGDRQATKLMNLLLEETNLNKDDFYLEIQYQDDLVADTTNERILKYAKSKGLKTVLTNDYHQITSDPKEQDALKLIQALGTKSIVGEKDTWFLPGEQHYIHTSQEIEAWGIEFSLLDSTIEIYNKVEVYSLESIKNFNPEFILPKEFKTEKEYFWYLANKGLKERFPVITPEYQERLDYELNIIDQMGFNGYFLIVADFINYSKRNYSSYDEETVNRWKDFLKRSGFPEEPIAIGPARGSCAGSLVAYSMAITEIDPIKYDLLFERFLNPERVSMPDIDTDIPDIRRAEVIEYTRDFYNISDNPIESRVAGIATFGTFKMKNGIKAAARGLYPKETGLKLGEKLAKLVEDANVTPSEFKKQSNVQNLVEGNPLLEKILEQATAIFGMVSNLGQHAAGYVIAPKPVTDFLPTVFVLSKKTGHYEQLTAYTHVEENGLLKMDFLGLRAMSIIQETLDDIKKQTGKEISVKYILQNALTDIKLYQHIEKGNTLDLFQLSSSGMTDMIVKSLADVNQVGAEDKALSGDFFSRIIAGISMYRPGPMKFVPQFIENALHPESIEYVVPEMADILKTSYGLMIYQESIMNLLQTIAGFTLGGADLARRAIGKKKMDILAGLKNTFIFGDEKNGIPGGIKKSGRSQEELEVLWEDVEAFAAYGFNKSHAAGYSLIAIAEAWLATYYPTYFATANLNNANDNIPVAFLVPYYKKQGIETVGLDLNQSSSNFTTDGEKLYLGFDGIKYVSSQAPNIFDEREKNGNFKSYYDFISRIARRENSKITKAVIEALIYSGAFDSYPGTRKDKINSLDKVGALMTLLKKESDKQLLFDQLNSNYFETYLEFNYDEEISNQELLKKEKDYTGFYISGHPTDEFKNVAKRNPDYLELHSVAEKRGKETIYNLELLGVITKVHRITTKKNDLMAFITVQDTTAEIEMIVFPNSYSDFGRYLKEDRVVFINANLDSKGSIIVNSLRSPGEIKLETEVDHIQLDLNGNSNAPEILKRIVQESSRLEHRTSPQIPLSYLFKQKEFYSTKEFSDLEFPLDLTMLSFTKKLISAEKLNLIWNSSEMITEKQTGLNSIQNIESYINPENLII